MSILSRDDIRLATESATRRAAEEYTLEIHGPTIMSATKLAALRAALDGTEDAIRHATRHATDDATRTAAWDLVGRL